MIAISPKQSPMLKRLNLIGTPRQSFSTITEPVVKISGAAVIAAVILFTIWFR